MKLNARQVDAAKPREKAYKLADGAGLYLEVFLSGESPRTSYQLEDNGAANVSKPSRSRLITRI